MATRGPHLDTLRGAILAGVWCAGLALPGCMGELEEPGSPDPNRGAADPGGVEDVAATCEEVGIDAGPTVLRRLSEGEYRLTLADLFELEDAPELAGLPPDTRRAGFTTYADLQGVSAQHLRSYWEAAELLADDLLADEERAARVIGCDQEDATCLPGFVERFGRLAFRRTLEEAERDAFTSAAEQNALDVPDRYRFVIEALLLSPHFLYRVEIGDDPEGISRLDAHELAARLSFTLWGRGPDATLLQHADDGDLDTDEGFAEMAETYLQDERTRLHFASFFEQWLGFAELIPPKDPPADWDDELLDQMARETHAVVADHAWQGGDFLDLLTTNATRLTPELGAFYGLEPGGAPFDFDSPYTFSTGHPRANTGILTHASLLIAKSDGDRISIRGNWLRNTFLCSHIEIPPSLAEELGDRLVGLTRVEIVQERNTDSACKGCHARIDPIGIGFESFDATGRYDPNVDVHQFGISPAFPDAAEPEFASIAELAQKLRELPAVNECLTKRGFLYAQGRDPVRADACLVASAARDFADSGADFSALLRGIVTSPAFRLRRAPIVP